MSPPASSSSLIAAMIFPCTNQTCTLYETPTRSFIQVQAIPSRGGVVNRLSQKSSRIDLLAAFVTRKKGSDPRDFCGYCSRVKISLKDRLTLDRSLFKLCRFQILQILNFANFEHYKFQTLKISNFANFKFLKFANFRFSNFLNIVNFKHSKFQTLQISNFANFRFSNLSNFANFKHSKFQIF